MNLLKENQDCNSQIFEVTFDSQEDSLSENSNELSLDDSYMDDCFDDATVDDNIKNSGDIWNIMVREEQKIRDKMKDKYAELIIGHKWSALMTLEKENSDVMKWMIKEKIDEVNRRDNQGKTLLYLAYKENNIEFTKYLVSINVEIHEELVLVAKNNDENMVKYMIDHGADVNAKEIEDNFETPIFKAIRNNNENMLKYLIHHGAKVNMKNFDMETPLLLAAKFKCEDLIMKYLIDHSANVNVKDKNGNFPLYILINDNNEYMVQYLIDHGANVNMDVDPTNLLTSKTPLLLATQKNNDHIVKILVEKEANIMVTNRYGSPIMIATKNNNEIILKCLLENNYPKNKKTIHSLLNDIRDATGNFPLLEAVKNNNEDMVNLLINYGANINLSNVIGETPLLVAKKNNNETMMKLLMDHSKC